MEMFLNFASPGRFCPSRALLLRWLRALGFGTVLWVWSMVRASEDSKRVGLFKLSDPDGSSIFGRSRCPDRLLTGLVAICHRSCAAVLRAACFTANNYRMKNKDLEHVWMEVLVLVCSKLTPKQTL
jgi:hypothetical protein